MLNLQQVTDLEASGFKMSYDLKVAFEEDAEAKGVGATGPYVVDAAYTKGLVTLKFEQNTSSETDPSGQQINIKYSPVCVVQGPGGVASCAATDTPLILALSEALK